MKAVVQRVLSAVLTVDGNEISRIGRGFVVYFGVAKGDDAEKCDYIVKKIASLRAFEDENGKTNLSLSDVGGSVLFVSQFTLLADLKKGNRPSFTEAEEPQKAKEKYLYSAQKLIGQGIDVKLGVFGADMKITQVNDGPFTLVYEI